MAWSGDVMDGKSVAGATQLTVRRADGSAASMELRVGIPRVGPACFECAYEITFAGRTRGDVLFGEDSLQALLMCLSVAAGEVANTARRAGGVIEASEEWGLLQRHGFP